MARENTLAYFVPSVKNKNNFVILTGVKDMQLFYFAAETPDK
jgi:hypothetical protein